MRGNTKDRDFRLAILFNQLNLALVHSGSLACEINYGVVITSTEIANNLRLFQIM